MQSPLLRVNIVSSAAAARPAVRPGPHADRAPRRTWSAVSTDSQTTPIEKSGSFHIAIA